MRPEDLRPIADLQFAQELAAESRARAAGRRLVVRDTDLVSTWVYGHHAGGPRWLEDAARARRADLYLLCDTDVAWADDPVRTPGADTPEARRAALDSFERWLRYFECRYVWVRGVGPDRLARALAAVRGAGLAPAETPNGSAAARSEPEP